MNENEQLRSEIEKIEVPDELLPENIALMLKAKTANNFSARITKTSGRSSSAVFRTIAAAAACLALGAGFVIYSDKVSEPASLDSKIEYKDVSNPNSYDDLYDIYTQICLNGDASVQEYETDDDMPANDIADGLTETDILKAENGTIYYIKDGSLCTITDDGSILSADLGIDSPIDMYIDKDRLVIISGSNASKTLSASEVPADDAAAAGSSTSGQTGESSGMAEIRNSVTADIYDISEGAILKHLESFTQSGEYVSSRIFGGSLSIVTDYSDYHTKPLGEETDLDNYVPYYELNGKRIYAAAEDIYVTANAVSTEYTVVSSYNINGGAVSVKAVLGSAGRVFCPGDTLYIVTPGQNENEKPYTAISSFSLGSTIEYISGGSVEGTVIGRSLDEKDGCLRAAARNTLDDGTMCTDVYVLDRDLSVVNSAGQLLPGEKLTKASFAGDYVSLYTDRNTAPSMILKLSEVPPQIAGDMMASGNSYYTAFGDRLILGAGTAETESGECFMLSMFDAGSGAKYDSVKFAEGIEISSPAGKSRRALLIDTAQGIIGVPVSYDDEFGTHSLYYLYRYTDDNGFIEIGRVEYTDPGENSGFRRAVINGGTIYIISDTRIVVARTEDMKVIQVLETD